MLIAALRPHIAVLAVATSVACSAAAQTETRFRIRDHVGVNWGPAVVTYRVTFDKPVQSSDLALRDAAGLPLLFQLANEQQVKGGGIAAADLRFLAAVPANGAAEYVLTTGGAKEAPAGLTPVTVQKSGKAVELANGKARLRLPGEARETYKRAADAATVPGPFQAVQLADGTWAGRSKLETARAITSFTCEVLEAGPVSARVRLEYTFAPQGYYRLLIRLDQDAPLAQVEEEFDFGAFTEGSDILALDLTAGWKPDVLAWLADRPFKQTEGLKNRMAENKARDWAAGGYYEMPLADAASEDGQYVHPWGAWGVSVPVPPAQNWLYLMPWPDFGPRAAYIGTCRATAAPAERTPQIGVLSLHTGTWRRPSNAMVRLRATTDGAAVLEMPISCFGVMRPFNPFDSAEEDPSVPPTLGQRVWGLVSGIATPAELAEWQIRYGMIGLDRYKEWVLEWDAKPEMDPATYPRAYTDAAGLKAIRASLDQNPLQAELNKNTLVNPAAADGLAAVQNTLAQNLAERTIALSAHFRMAQYDNGIVPQLDAALAGPGLKDDARRLLLAKIAAMAYTLADPDFNPRGIGMHLGNPNMPINRYMGFPQYANLLPSHPRHGLWMEEAKRYMLWKLADNVSPGGAWREEITYQQAGLPHILEAAINLRNGGEKIDDLLPYIREQNSYNLACVCPPDLNERGLRASEGTGNGGRVRTGFPVYAANLLRGHDPELAGKLLWLWDAFGRPAGAHGLVPLTVDTGIARVTPADVPGAFLPGYGATARAHFATPGETFLMFRCGYNQSHYDMDQGSFKFYAFGEHLIPNSSRGYAAPPAPTMQHGLLLFGDADKPWTQNHGRTDTIIADYAYLDSVDHLLGWQRFDSKSGGNQGDREPKAFEWYRQFLFMKSRDATNSSYFVLRDTLRGKASPPSHFNTWVIGDDTRIARQGGALTVTTPQNNRLDLRFLEPTTAEPRVTFIPAATPNPFGIATNGSTEIRVSQPSGQGYLVVAYPRTAQMAAPQTERLAEGVVKVVTSAGTDYVFLSPDAEIAFKNAEVSFTGRAGAVRIRNDEVRFVLASGAGSVGYKGHLLSGLAPFDVGVPLADAGTAVARAVAPAQPLPAPLPFKPLVAGARVAIQPSVTQVTGAAGTAYLFDAAADGQSLDVTLPGGIRFRGRQGAVEILADRVRYLMQPDPALGFLCEIGKDGFVIRGEGPYDLTFTTSSKDGEGGEVTGVAAGRMRVLDMPLPMNLVPPNCPQKALPSGQIQAQADGPILTGVAPSLYLNGKQWQVGYYDRRLALNVFDGENTIRITRFHVPPLPPVER